MIATTNSKKKDELIKLLGDVDFKILSLADFKDIPRVKEDSNSFEGNAIKKAIAVSRYTKLPTIAEDSGLVVDVLDGRPGVYSARFAGSKQDDEANNAKLLRLLEGVPFYKRRARFICCVALADSGRLIDIKKGSVSGYISFEPKGRYGFGYDPLFYYPSLKKNFAQLLPSQKNKVSHRAKAILKIRKSILKYINNIRSGLNS